MREAMQPLTYSPPVYMQQVKQNASASAVGKKLGMVEKS